MVPLLHMGSGLYSTACTLMSTHALGLPWYADVGTLPQEVHGYAHPICNIDDNLPFVACVTLSK